MPNVLASLAPLSITTVHVQETDWFVEFNSSGEINFNVADPDKLLNFIEDYYKSECTRCYYLDGLSMEFEDWRLNLRKSNTEPLVRLNIESRKGRTLMKSKVMELRNLINFNS